MQDGPGTPWDGGIQESFTSGILTEAVTHSEILSVVAKVQAKLTANRYEAIVSARGYNPRKRKSNFNYTHNPRPRNHTPTFSSVPGESIIDFSVQTDSVQRNQVNPLNTGQSYITGARTMALFLRAMVQKSSTLTSKPIVPLITQRQSRFHLYRRSKICIRKLTFQHLDSIAGSGHVTP